MYTGVSKVCRNTRPYYNASPGFREAFLVYTTEFPRCAEIQDSIITRLQASGKHFRYVHFLMKAWETVASTNLLTAKSLAYFRSDGRAAQDMS